MTTDAADPARTVRRSAPVATGALRRALGPRRRNRAYRFLVFAAPGLVLYAAIVMVPIGVSAYHSLTNLNLLRERTAFVGLTNYADLLTDEDFLNSVKVTVTIGVLMVTVPNALGLALAMLLDRNRRIYKVLRSVFFVPMILSSVVVSFIWAIMLTDEGVVNNLLRAVRLDGLTRSWLGDPDLAVYSVATVVCWQALGFCVVLWLAALQAVPADLMDAAAVDGANAWQRFRAVTWPMIAPGLTINVVILLISGFKVYDHIVVLTAGGPGTSTQSLAMGIITTGFTDNRTGYAAAMSMVLLVAVIVVTFGALWFLQRREVEQ